MEWEIEVTPDVGSWGSHGRTFRPGTHITDRADLAHQASQVKGINVTPMAEVMPPSDDDPEDELTEDEADAEPFRAETEPVATGVTATIAGSPQVNSSTDNGGGEAPQDTGDEEKAPESTDPPPTQRTARKPRNS